MSSTTTIQCKVIGENPVGSGSIGGVILRMAVFVLYTAQLKKCSKGYTYYIEKRRRTTDTWTSSVSHPALALSRSLGFACGGGLGSARVVRDARRGCWELELEHPRVYSRDNKNSGLLVAPRHGRREEEKAESRAGKGK